VGSGGTSGMVTDDSEVLRLDNMKSEVDGGACYDYSIRSFKTGGDDRFFLFAVVREGVRRINNLPCTVCVCHYCLLRVVRIRK